jgi:hypothetical protein
MPKRTKALTGVGPDDPREMALIDKPEIGRELGQILVPVCQTFECDRDPDSISKLRERHPSRSRKDAADVKTCVPESLG